MTRLTVLFLALCVGVALAGDSLEAKYGAKMKALEEDDLEAHYRLALWCHEHGMKSRAVRHHRAVVTLNGDHRASRRALGYEQVHGRWLRGDDVMRAKGFVEHDGIWMTPQEYGLYAKDEVAAKRAKEARRAANEALKLAWNKDPEVRGRAMGAIERIDAEHRLRPLSIAARINRRDVRLRAVRALGVLDDPDALPPLYKRAIFDQDEAVRLAAVGAIKSTKAINKIGPFVQALASPFDVVRVHAIEALGVMGDASAVGPLIARFQIAGGSGQSVYISQANQISYVQDFDVEVAQTAFIADPVIGVIQDGLVLNFRALAVDGYIDVYEKPALAESLGKLTGKDLGDDPKDWLTWYRNEQAAKKNS